jgi:cation diffusion facilitator family transporter
MHHHHDHGHPHEHSSHDHHHHDLNLRSAYVHVLSDAATSMLAILALFSGKLLQANWLDPAMGIVGAALIIIWAYGLLRDTGRVLLDAEMDTPVVAEIHEVVETSSVKAEITDLHVWWVGKGKYDCILSLAVQGDTTPDEFRKLLSIHAELVNVTIEINTQVNLQGPLKPA